MVVCAEVIEVAVMVGYNLFRTQNVVVDSTMGIGNECDIAIPIFCQKRQRASMDI